MKKHNGKVLAAIFTVLGIAAFAAVIVLSYFAVRDLSGSYGMVKESDLTQDFRASLSYNDRLYAVLGSATQYEPSNGDTPERLASFLESGLRSIDKRIFCAGIVYTLFIGMLFGYPLCRKMRDKARGLLGTVIFLNLLVYILYLGSVYGMHHRFGTPFYFPDLHGILMLAAGIVSVIGGVSALTLLLYKARFQKTAAILVIPVIAAAFLFGFVFEAGIYSEPFTDSFGYIAGVDPRAADENFEGEFYYDEEKNVVILEGTEYPPEKVASEEYMQPPKRYGAIAFEVLYPYAGSGLYLVEDALETRIGTLYPCLYILKGLLWALVAGGILWGADGRKARS